MLVLLVLAGYVAMKIVQHLGGDIDDQALAFTAVYALGFGPWLRRTLRQIDSQNGPRAMSALVLVSVSLFGLPGCGDDPIAPSPDPVTGPALGTITTSSDTILVDEVYAEFEAEWSTDEHYDVSFLSEGVEVIDLRVETGAVPDSTWGYPFGIFFSTETPGQMDFCGGAGDGIIWNCFFAPGWDIVQIGTGKLQIDEFGPDWIRGSLVVETKDAEKIDVGFWAPVNDIE